MVFQNMLFGVFAGIILRFFRQGLTSPVVCRNEVNHSQRPLTVRLRRIRAIEITMIPFIMTTTATTMKTMTSAAIMAMT